MFKQFLANLFDKPGPLAPLVWTCNPLLIVDEDDNVLYAETTDVEFTPEDELGVRGIAKALKRDKDDREHMLSVRERINRPVSVDVHIRSRGGFTLIGEDIAGETMTWYIAQAADDYLRLRGTTEAAA